MAKNCINPKCGKEIPTSATFCSFCGAQQVDNKNLTEEEKMRKELNEMQETISLLKKALADAQQNNDTSTEHVQKNEGLQKQLIDMQKKYDILQDLIKRGSIKKDPKPFPTTILVVGLALLLVVGSFVGYFGFYKPYAFDRDAERYYTYVNSTVLRSSEQAGVDYNKLGSMPYGAELIMYNKGNDWSEVKWKNIQNNRAIKGYISTALILSAEDFNILNNLFGDKDSKDIINTGKCRIALLNYFKTNNLNGWKVYSKQKDAKYNTIYYPKIVNPNSKFTDFAVIIKNDSTNVRKCLLFNFDDDETPHLAYEEQAPLMGDIVSITRDFNSTFNTYNYRITYR